MVAKKKGPGGRSEKDVYVPTGNAVMDATSTLLHVVQVIHSYVRGRPSDYRGIWPAEQKFTDFFKVLSVETHKKYQELFMSDPELLDQLGADCLIELAELLYGFHLVYPKMSAAERTSEGEALVKLIKDYLPNFEGPATGVKHRELQAKLGGHKKASYERIAMCSGWKRETLIKRGKQRKPHHLGYPSPVIPHAVVDMLLEVYGFGDEERHKVSQILSRSPLKSPPIIWKRLRAHRPGAPKDSLVEDDVVADLKEG